MTKTENPILRKRAGSTVSHPLQLDRHHSEKDRIIPLIPVLLSADLKIYYLRSSFRDSLIQSLSVSN